MSSEQYSPNKLHDNSMVLANHVLHKCIKRMYGKGGNGENKNKAIYTAKELPRLRLYEKEHP